ncbi:GNAT family N-acetyltransferase [Hyalangium gracile]|uniref:GNAT family N-acetyltransferase n=1 Tax=Hyalangium gracile TaxID=394092 RepID=UPI001CCF8485|nr:GNAT family N-acetyltransferase [Hyalangium gracile]
MLLLPPDSGLTARRIDENDTAALQALCEACTDYHELIYGQPAAPDEASQLLRMLPPGKTLADKLIFGLFTPRPRLCGVLDVARDYREPGEWYLGLLLLEPAVRGHGQGERVLRALEDWARSQGARRMRLACAEQNEAGRRFWERQGYRVDRRFPPRRMGVRDTVLLEFLRELTQGHAESRSKSSAE